MPISRIDGKGFVFIHYGIPTLHGCQAGTDLFTVQKQLGHTTATMTQRYSHLQENHFKTVTKIFDDTKESEQRSKVKSITDDKKRLLEYSIYGILLWYGMLT